MNYLLKNLTEMNGMSDQIVASDMLITAKSGVKDLAVAITEAATPEIRNVLKKHLDTAIQTHEAITSYMVEKGFYHPYNVHEQLQVDINAATTSLNFINGRE
ncbi:spore coat protein [Paenibacillus alvei]|uniref:Spore coat protein n=1 Tax=Paenibacillus alvei TaxID=44250 RepID=A0AAP7A5A2_PAEAL|nr:spore coat protein [Paenibacillus alvei]MBG9733469.1 spore gernimation protein GerQ [Paenibacillus alvei]MBG9742676.1 spore gernimation protein GerQ [Paenibacillus alvei]MCY9581505.1 spore coat protein [Paenibacillus alvei]MCY9585488.1 spore coat protein [Paenibacillus alvei]NEZ41795.1 spore coat protein [Paenibacillus alvei]